MEFKIRNFVPLLLAAMLILGVEMWPASIPAGDAFAEEPNRNARGDGHDDHEGHDHDAHTDDDHAEEDDDHEGSDHSAHADGEGAEDEDHDDHGHGDHEGEGLRLSDKQLKRFGIEVRRAGAGILRSEVNLPGEVVFNEDHVVHMVPRVSGVVRQVSASVGENLSKGDLLAVIDSREIADAKAKFLAAKARAVLAETKFQRETALREQEISSEQDFLDVEQALAEAKIELRSAEHQLHALGLSEDAVRRVDGENGEAMTRYEIRSPIDGMVTEKHISLGESLKDSSNIFTLVDLSSIWINLAVHTKNLTTVRKGGAVEIHAEYGGAQGRGEVFMVTPFVEESTRTATARVVMDNSDGRWIPGTFVTGLISSSDQNAAVVVPKDAVQSIEGESVVFVEHNGSFESIPVETGRTDREHVEIVVGLQPGMRYVAKGAFELKATIVTSTFDAHAGHGH